MCYIESLKNRKKSYTHVPLTSLSTCMVVWISVLVTVWGCLISSQSPIEGLQILSPLPKKLETEEKVNIFFTYVISLNLDENFLGIAVLYFASLCLFFR